MPVKSELSIDELKPVRTSTPNTPEPSKPFPGATENEINDDPSFISHVHGHGDFTVVSGAVGTNNPPPVLEEAVGGTSKIPRQRSSSLQRVKATLNKTQSQIVELFSRGSLAKSKNLQKSNSIKKKSDVSTIVASTSTSSSSEPKLLAAHRKSSTPMLRDPDLQRQTSHSYKLEANADPHQSPRLPEDRVYQSVYGQSARNQPGAFDIKSSSRLPSSRCGANFSTLQEEKNEQEKVLLEENKKLQQENSQLWRDNETLATSVRDLEAKVEYLQERSEYLETAMHQEGKVLTDIIKECHEEISRLRTTQCELLSGENIGYIPNPRDKDFERRIREYYISKYSNGEGDFPQTLQ